MKKFIISILFAIISIAAYAQTSIYIVFSPIPDQIMIPGIKHRVNTRIDPKMDRYEPHYFTIVNTSLMFNKRFLYENTFNHPDNPIQSKPVSLLDSVQVIDWDEFGSKLTKTDAESMVAYICTHDNIYFIDKREIKDGIMKVVPVKFLKLSDDILLY